MGVSYQKGNMVDKGWSYLPMANKGVKETKKGGLDVGTRSPTLKALNPV